MNNKITNPFLKQMLTEISSNAVKGRMTDINWATLNEAKKKKTLKKEVAKRPPPQEDPNAGGEDEIPNQANDPAPAPDAGNQVPPDGSPESPDLGGDLSQEVPPSDSPDMGDEADAPPIESPTETPGQAEEEAEEAKASVERAKAEKDQAEKELEDQSYIKLSSHSGTQFLLSKILDHAFKTNTTDSLAGEMVGKLKIDTPEDMSEFVEELGPFMTIPGMAQLISSMKSLATKQSDTSSPTEPSDEPQNV